MLLLVLIYGNSTCNLLINQSSTISYLRGLGLFNMVASRSRKGGKRSTKKRATSKLTRAKLGSAAKADDEQPEALKARQKSCREQGLVCIRDEGEAKEKYSSWFTNLGRWLQRNTLVWLISAPHRRMESDDLRRRRKARAKLQALKKRKEAAMTGLRTAEAALGDLELDDELPEEPETHHTEKGNLMCGKATEGFLYHISTKRTPSVPRFLQEGTWT